MTNEEYSAKERELLEDFHPTLASVLRSQAYEHGHSAGHEEVLNILNGLVFDFRAVNLLLKGANLLISDHAAYVPPPRKERKVHPPPPELPEWLYDISYGLDGHKYFRVLLENERYAIVQCPGSTWGDGTGRHYGSATYYKVDKMLLPLMRKSGGIMDAETIQDGGRPKLAQWKKLIEQPSTQGEELICPRHNVSYTLRGGVKFCDRCHGEQHAK